MVWQPQTRCPKQTPASILIGCVLVIANGFCSPKILDADTIPEIVARAKSAVIQIVTLDQNRQPLKTGTGFFVSGDGYLLTNNHVIEGGPTLTARTSSGATYTFESVAVRSTDPDLAELKFTATDVPHLQLGSSDKTVEGQKKFLLSEIRKVFKGACRTALYRHSGITER